MMKKAENALLQAFLRVRLAVMKFEQEERGDAVQTIIMIGIGVILAVILYNVLTGGNSDMSYGDDMSDKGLIGSVFQNIKNKIDEIFGTT
ncbi:MAG: hypothetical protein K2H29_08590 [Oscillospiraceae bacterium]|nr:hypothetical protein [Oscillospiraceae bacterium]